MYLTSQCIVRKVNLCQLQMSIIARETQTSLFREKVQEASMLENFFFLRNLGTNKLECFLYCNNFHPSFLFANRTNSCKTLHLTLPTNIRLRIILLATENNLAYLVQKYRRQCWQTEQLRSKKLECLSLARFIIQVQHFTSRILHERSTLKVLNVQVNFYISGVLNCTDVF